MKKTLRELEETLRMNLKPLPDTRWRHTKTGRHYRVTGNSIDCDTNEIRVHYENISEWSDTDIDPVIPFSRPRSEWFEDTEYGPRFEEVYKRDVWVTKAQAREVAKYNGSKAT